MCYGYDFTGSHHVSTLLRTMIRLSHLGQSNWIKEVSHLHWLDFGLPHIERSTTTQCALLFWTTQNVLLGIPFVGYYRFSERNQSSDATLGKSI